MSTDSDMSDEPWWIYRGLSEDELREASAEQAPAEPDSGDREPQLRLPQAVRDALHPDNAPPWRRFGTEAKEWDRGADFLVDADVKNRVNAALLLRRPLLLTGPPGTGKTSLAYAVGRELGLSPVLRWSITSRTELRDGLYRYDAIARLQDTQRFFSSSAAADQQSQARRARPWMGRALAQRRQPPSIQDYLKLGQYRSAHILLSHGLASFSLVSQLKGNKSEFFTTVNQ